MSLSPLYSSSAYGITSPDNLSLLINLDYSSLGPTPKLVANAVRHLCGLLFPDENLKPIPFDNYYEIATEYYQQIAMSDPTGRNLMIFLSYFSTYFHEIRHVHDLLSTAYGQTILFSNFNFYQNVPVLLNALHTWQTKNPQNLIPIPILGNLELLTGLPEDILQLINKYPGMHESLNNIEQTGALYSNLSVTHLLECSATISQLELIGDVFGHDAVLDFIKYIQTGNHSHSKLDIQISKSVDTLRLYLHIINEFYEVFEAKGFHGNIGTAIRYICWCSLFGATFHDKPRTEGISVMAFYEALVEYTIRKAESVELHHIQDIVDDFCRKWGLMTPKEMALRTGIERENILNKLEKTWQSRDDLDFSFIHCYRGFTKGYNDMCKTIIDFPESYFENYAWAVMYGVLPSVRVLVKVDNSVYTFMSSGYGILEPDDWEDVAQLSITLKLLLNGRDLKSPFAFIEDVCFNTLLNEHNLRFKNMNFTF